MVVTWTIFDTDFPNNVMPDLHCPILNFDGTEIDSIEGYFRTTAFFNGQQCSALIYIANDMQTSDRKRSAYASRNDHRIWVTNSPSD